MHLHAQLKGIKEKHFWEITHVFYLLFVFGFFIVEELLLISVATPLYLYFAVLLCQGELLMQSCGLFSGLHWNRLLFVTVLGIKKSKKIQMMLRFFVLFPYDVTNLIFTFFHLSDGSASKKIIITDCSGLTDSVFYFAFSVLQVFKWILFHGKLAT